MTGGVLLSQHPLKGQYLKQKEQIYHADSILAKGATSFRPVSVATYFPNMREKCITLLDRFNKNIINIIIFIKIYFGSIYQPKQTFLGLTYQCQHQQMF